MSGIKLFIMALSFVVLTASCAGKRYTVFQYDNGDDYFCDGLQRIVGNDGSIGFADEKGKVVIKPTYAFAFPFENGVSKATFEGHEVAEDEHSRWISDNWFYIDRTGNQIPLAKVLEARLQNYIADKDSRIGVAIIIDGKDTVAVNGNRDFPMLSVFKFPEALAVADYCNRNNVSLSEKISITADDLKENTWSPLRDKYGRKDMSLPLSELIEYSLSQSDNNACDILFGLIGGTEAADSLMKSMGYDQIHIQATEDDMHRDIYLCYQNRSTPIEMARLFDAFYRLGMRHQSPVYEAIGSIMISCETGKNRLPKPLARANAAIGHKTGTGDRNSQDRIIAVNDAGYIFLPDGHGYAIAVFVSDSAYDMNATEKIIADISEIVFDFLYSGTSIAGTYTSPVDGSSLTIINCGDGSYHVEIELFRLTNIDDGKGVFSDNLLKFTATDAAGSPISGEIAFDGPKAILTFTDSHWEYIPNGTSFEF